MRNTPLGHLFVLEGVDGVGKTTLAKLLTARLEATGVNCKYLAFPGHEPGTLGSLVYQLHHGPAQFGLPPIDATSLQLLHVAAHLDAINRLIRPSLDDGQTVILDRFWWSTVAYGRSTGVDESSLSKMVAIEKQHWESILPTALFLIFRPTDTGTGTACNDKDHNDLARVYRELGENETRHCVVMINNDATVENALDSILKIVGKALKTGSSKRSPHSSVPARADQLGLTSYPERQIVLDRPIIWERPAPPVPSAVFNTYWRFAAERQEIFFRRLIGAAHPWTEDAILQHYKFTNAYRASDRVSQYLIRNVVYCGEQTPEEVFFRVILFKLFNKVDTWERLSSECGPVRYADSPFAHYDRVLTAALTRGERIYSGAYMMPSSRQTGLPRKHANHLWLLERMMREEVPERLAGCRGMSEAFTILRSYPMIGDFLAYQYVTDLNYSEITNFSEREFTIPGPGARDGIRKCFTSLGGVSEPDVIRLIADRQQEEFARLGLSFRSLWGRDLQLIDCQNLFCEVDKYARIAHPDVKGISGRERIKQTYHPGEAPITYWYPPKWGLNHRIAETRGSDHHAI